MISLVLLDEEFEQWINAFDFVIEEAKNVSEITKRNR